MRIIALASMIGWLTCPLAAQVVGEDRCPGHVGPGAQADSVVLAVAEDSWGPGANVTRGEVAAKLRAAQRIGPFSPVAWSVVYQLMLFLDMADSGIALASEGAALWPNCAAVYVARAHLTAISRREAAIAELRELESRFPHDPYALAGAARVWCEINDFAAAAWLYERALRQDSTIITRHPELHRSYELVRRVTGRLPPLQTAPQ